MNFTLYVVSLTADYGDYSVVSHLVGVFNDEKLARKAMLEAAKNEKEYLVRELHYNPELISIEENTNDEDGYNIYSDDESEVAGLISQITLTKTILNDNLEGARGEQTASI